MRTLRPLVRLFIGSLIGRGVLQDEGVEAVRGLLFGVVALLVTVGVMLPRRFSEIYLRLSSLSDPEPFRHALVADSLFMLTVPFLVALLATALVCSSVFPDEIDYLTLVPLPVSKTSIFAAKLIALALVVGALLASLSVFAALSFPLFTHYRWTEGHILRRMVAHGMAAFGAGLFGALCVVAYQGLGSVWAPRRWVARLSVIVPSSVIVGVILSLPFVVHLEGERAWIAAEPAMLSIYPPAWFLGFERVALGVASPYWRAMAWIGTIGTAATIAVVTGAYGWLYWRFERLVLPSPRRSPSDRSVALDGTRLGVWPFTRATLFRNRLPLLLFLAFSALGIGIVTLPLLNAYGEWRTPGRVPRDFVNATLAAPLILVLTGLAGLRTAFLLPVQSRANWIFRVTDTPSMRASHRRAVERAFWQLVVVPAILVGALLQLMAVGAEAWRTVALSGLAGLVMAEVYFVGWCRVPFTCSWIPGKRPLALTLLSALVIFLVVDRGLASLLHVTLSSWTATTILAGLLAIVGVATRRYRQRLWEAGPLQFEEEPFQLQTLGLQ